MPLPSPFVDYYEVLDADPSTSSADLKKKYFSLLRKYHPDKRKTLINGVGHKMTQALNEAWAVLSDPEKREAYDVQWRREVNKKGTQVGGFGVFASDARNRAPQSARAAGRREESTDRKPSSARESTPTPGSEWWRAGSPMRMFWRRPFSARDGKAAAAADSDEQSRPERDVFQRPHCYFEHNAEARAEALRKEGNVMFKAAKQFDNVESKNFEADIAAARLHSYKGAISKYSLAIELTPSDHRLYTNRALCYLATNEWIACHEDAKKATQMKPDFMKGWFLLVKSSMRQGNATVAEVELDEALIFLPNSEELLSLKAELSTCRCTEQDASPNPIPSRVKPRKHRSESCPPPAPPRSARASPGRPPLQPRAPPRPESGAHKRYVDWDFINGSPFSRDSAHKPSDEQEPRTPSRGRCPPGARGSWASYQCRAGGC